jgi:hypothetical protein
MIRPTSPKAIECYDRAARARKLALECNDPFERANYFESGARWARLGERYEFSARLPSHLKVPPQVTEPRCPVCAVPMQLVTVEHVSGNPSQDKLHHECKVCDAKLVLPEASETAGERAPDPRHSNAA